MTFISCSDFLSFFSAIRIFSIVLSIVLSAARASGQRRHLLSGWVTFKVLAAQNFLPPCTFLETDQTKPERLPRTVSGDPYRWL